MSIHIYIGLENKAKNQWGDGERGMRKSGVIKMSKFNKQYIPA